MIRLNIDKYKRLTAEYKIEVYEGENDFDNIQVVSYSKVTENDVPDYQVELVFNVNGSEIINVLTTDSEKGNYIYFAPVSVSSALTLGKGTVNVYVRFVKDTILGKTNDLSISILENGENGHQITEETLTAYPSDEIQTFTSANGYKTVIISAVETEEKTVQSTTQTLEVLPSDGKFISKVTVLPDPVYTALDNIEATQTAISSKIDGIDTKVDDIEDTVDEIKSFVENSGASVSGTTLIV